MRVVIAPNSFKNCLGARDVAEALARGVRSACPGAETDIIPLSDGGDGLVSVLAGTLGGELVESDTLDALGRPVKAAWLKSDRYAVIEMALASGLARLKGPEEYAPLKASTFGTGVLIRAALDSGCRHLVIGLGGSATVDAGCGMALALGFRLEDGDGNSIPEGGGGLACLRRISRPRRNGARLKDVTVTALVDVQNPLLGSSGAARVYAPQKGAAPDEVELLERGLACWATIVERDVGVSVASVPGAGAAGGMGAGCVAFLGAALEPGAAWVANESGLAEAIRNADVVFTGEGRIDSQTRFGKVPAYVGQMAKAMNKPVVAFGGSVAKDADLVSIGISECIQISPPETGLAEAIRNAAENLEKASAKVVAKVLSKIEK